MAARTTTTKAATETTPQPPDPEGLNVGTVHPLHAEPARAADGLGRLRAGFPAEAIGKLPKSTCRACSDARNKRCDSHRWVQGCPECKGNHSSATMHIDYVGHADVTARLLEVDPAWTWEPFAVGPDGLPARDRSGDLWIRLTVLGVTRPGVGDGKSTKECIGDAIRNAAMRFGVALDLWAKGDRTWAQSDETPEGQPAPLRETQGPPPDAKADRPQGSVHHGQVEVANARPNDGTDPRVGVHVEAFWTDFNALTPPQQQQVRLGWPQGFPNPDALSVNQVAVVRDLCAQVRGPVGAPDPS